MADSNLWHTFWSSYNLNRSNNSSLAGRGGAGGGVEGSQQQQPLQQKQKWRQRETAVVAAATALPSVSAISLESYDELVRALTRNDAAASSMTAVRAVSEAATATEGAAAAASEQPPSSSFSSLSSRVLPRRTCRRVTGALDAASLPLSSLRALLSLHGCTAGHKAAKFEILGRLAGARVRSPEIVATTATSTAVGGGGSGEGRKGATFSSSSCPSFPPPTGVTSEDLEAMGWAVRGPRLDAALLRSAFDDEIEEGEEGQGTEDEAQEEASSPSLLPPVPSRGPPAADAPCVPSSVSGSLPPSKRARKIEPEVKLGGKGGGDERRGQEQQREEEEAGDEAKQQEEDQQRRQQREGQAELKLEAGTLVWAPLGASYWPAEVSEDISFPSPLSSFSSPSPSSSAATASAEAAGALSASVATATTLVQVRILGLQLRTRAPLVSLRPISDAFERRALLASRATAAGAVAVELARERMRSAEAGGEEKEKDNTEEVTAMEH